MNRNARHIKAIATVLKRRPTSLQVDVTPLTMPNAHSFHSYANANRAQQISVDYTLVSGWQVKTTAWREVNGTIFPHYFLYHVITGQYLDPTPVWTPPKTSQTYVLDMSLLQFSTHTNRYPPYVQLNADGTMFAKRGQKAIQVRTLDVTHLLSLF